MNSLWYPCGDYHTLFFGEIVSIGIDEDLILERA